MIPQFFTHIYICAKMHLDSDSSFQHYMVFSINFQSTKCIFVHIYIYVKKCGFILPRVPQDSNFSHGFLKTVTSPKHYKNQWFLLIISSFLHPCLPFCLTSPKHYKNQWFLLIISSFLHPSICSFLHPFLPASPPFCLSPYLPRTQKYPKRTMYLHSPF